MKITLKGRDIKNKSVYGLSRVGSSMLLDLATITIFLLYKDHFDPLRGVIVGNAFPLYLGIATMIGKFAIAISGLVMGYLSDRIKSKKYGRRKPFLITGAPLLALSFIMMFLPNIFLPPNPNQIQLFVWLLIWVTGFNWFYGYLITPYQAMMPEIFDEKGRMGAALSENIFNFIASIFIALVSFEIPNWIKIWNAQGTGPSSDYNLIILVLGILTVVFYLPAFFTLPTTQKFIPHPNYRRDLKFAAKNKNYLWYILFIGVSEAGLFIAVTVLIEFFDEVLFSVTDLDLIAAGVMGIVLLVSVYFWIKLSKKHSIHKSMFIGFVLLVITLPFSLVLSFLAGENLYVSLIYIAALSAGIGCEYLFQYVILGNIVEEDETRTGINHSGLYHGFLNAPENVFQGLGLFISGLLFLLPPVPGKYDPNGDPVSWGLYWWGPVSAFLIFLSLLIFRKIKVDLNEIKEVNKDLKVEGEMKFPKWLEKIFSFFGGIGSKKKDGGQKERELKRKKVYYGRMPSVEETEKEDQEKVDTKEEEEPETETEPEVEPEVETKKEEEPVVETKEEQDTIKPEKIKKQSNPPPSGNVCESCGREFKSERGLKIHIRSCKGS
ncbi:MAG: MFS transporter [Candidatus Hodarchaeota archaeon]